LIEKESVAMKKRKEDFMIFSVDTKGMYPQVLEALMFYRDMILKEISYQIAATPGSASTSTAASASIAASIATSVTVSASTLTSRPVMTSLMTSTLTPT
jgi:hypothetical protein